MRQQSEGLETFSQNFLSALWWLAKLFRTRYQNVFICSFKTNTAKISISSEVWVIFCKFWSKAVKVGTYWMLFAKKLGPVDCKKKLGPVDSDKRLGPVDCKKGQCTLCNQKQDRGFHCWFVVADLRSFFWWKIRQGKISFGIFPCG